MTVSLPLLTKRQQLIQQIQTLLKQGYSQREVARRMGISHQTVVKYSVGDWQELAKTGFRTNQLENALGDILISLNTGHSKSETIERLRHLGYDIPTLTLYDYFRRTEDLAQRRFSSTPYSQNKTHPLPHHLGTTGKKGDYLTRNGVFQYLWMNVALTDRHHDYLFSHYQILYEIKRCIQSFRQIYILTSIPCLYLFIETYKKCELTSLKSFAQGLENDLEAVENSVASDLSNGFVEGINNKLKVVKRTMYGKCHLPLLRAKLMLKIE